MARTFFDLCGDPEPGVPLDSPYHRRRMEKVYNDALGRRGMTFAQEAAVFSVMACRGRAGTALGRAILERFGPDHRSEEHTSELQSLMRISYAVFCLKKKKKQKQEQQTSTQQKIQQGTIE